MLRPAPCPARAAIRRDAASNASVPRLIGRDPTDIVTAMQGFKSGQRPATVMDRIAKGFSDDEVKAIAAWYSAQKD